MASLAILEKRKEKVEVPQNMVSSFTPYSTYHTNHEALTTLDSNTATSNINRTRFV